MNCPCCSAPLRGRELVCSYCGSRLDLDLSRWSGLHSSGLCDQLHCPDGHGALEALQLPGDPPLELGRCPACLGLFLPLGGLERLLAEGSEPVLSIDHRLLQALSETPGPAPGPLRYRRCPSCNELMHRNLHGKRSGVVVDRCRDHGLWLEAGELRQLLDWARAGGTLLDLERRQEERLQEARRLEAETRERQQRLAQAEVSPWLEAACREDLGELLLRLARRLG